MYALTLLVSAIGFASAAPSSDISIRQVAQVASVDRYAGHGCTGSICNKAGSGDLYPGCNKITDSCKSSLKLSYANLGCTVRAWTDSTCSSGTHFADINTYNCYDLGSPILSISVTC